MTLDEYRNSDDPNIFWRLSDGERENLLDEAIDLINKREAKLMELVERWKINCSCGICKQKADELEAVLKEVE